MLRSMKCSKSEIGIHIWFRECMLNADTVASQIERPNWRGRMSSFSSAIDLIMLLFNVYIYNSCFEILYSRYTLAHLTEDCRVISHGTHRCHVHIINIYVQYFNRPHNWWPHRVEHLSKITEPHTKLFEILADKLAYFSIGMYF